VISIFERFFHERRDFIDDPGVFLKEISLRAAAELMRIDDQRRKKEDHHAMLIAFFRDAGQLFTINVGNGRIVLYRNQELTQLTVDGFRFIQHPDHDIVFDPTDAPPQSQTGTLLGATFKTIELTVDGPIPLKKGDLILAFTHGVYELFSDLEIVGLLKRHQHASNLSQELIRAAREAGLKHEISICHLMI
jgi:serine/threonine protein phosphatase PrpC